MYLVILIRLMNFDSDIENKVTVGTKSGKWIEMEENDNS